MCPKCLPDNIARFGSKEEQMYTCPACTNRKEKSPIWIFVDNSNIWIEAKKLASKRKGFRSVEDHRLRISIGRLTDVVAGNRDVEKGILYGSEPPKIDSVWDKIREHENWYVKTKKRSYLTHKEKEIDSQLVADVTQLACKTPNCQRGTIILISGDADMCPAVEKIMEEGIWKVEIYMWKDALSDNLKKISERYRERVLCKPLDNHLNDVTFTNKKVPMDKLDKLGDLRKCSAVLLMEPGCFQQHVIKSRWWNQLESIAQWPVQYWWIVQDGEVTNELLLVFSSQRQSETYNVSNFVHMLSDDIAATRREAALLPHVQRAETYIDYIKRQRKFEAVMKTGSWVDIESDHNFVARNSVGSASIKVVETPAFGEEDFKSVPPSQVGGKQKDCIFGKNCSKGRKCILKHSESDKHFFDKYNGKGMPVRKAKMCPNLPSCRYTPAACNYAHGESDAWCLGCRKPGHFTNKCPNPW